MRTKHTPTKFVAFRDRYHSLCVYILYVSVIVSIYYFLTEV